MAVQRSSWGTSWTPSCCIKFSLSIALGTQICCQISEPSLPRLVPWAAFSESYIAVSMYEDDRRFGNCIFRAGFSPKRSASNVWSIKAPGKVALVYGKLTFGLQKCGEILGKSTAEVKLVDKNLLGSCRIEAEMGSNSCNYKWGKENLRIVLHFIYNKRFLFIFPKF